MVVEPVEQTRFDDPLASSDQREIERAAGQPRCEAAIDVSPSPLIQDSLGDGQLAKIANNRSIGGSVSEDEVFGRKVAHVGNRHDLRVADGER